MKDLWLTVDCEKAARKLEGRFPDPSNALHVLKDSGRVITRDGDVAAVWVRDVVPAALCSRAYELLKVVKEPIVNRPTAVGTPSLPLRINGAGLPTPRRGVNAIVADVSPAQYGILGWKAPDKQTPLTQKHPEMLAGNRALIELCDTVYAEKLGHSYKKQQAAFDNMPWRLWKTVFTNVYVAKSFQTAYHRDGNLRSAKTVITPVGEFSGGELVLLRWRVTIPYQPGDIVIFNAEDLHGNLPFKGKRISLASYVPRWLGVQSHG